MCGIAGVFRFDGARVDPSLLRTMADQLVHRGPDDDGVWTAPGVGFGHRRLSIIDLAGSPQPMSTADGQITITFNGEILNYQSLRSSLSGYPFRTGGDTETILASYREHGAGLTKSLRGQWAFAIHDQSTDELLLSRDRLGVLPLYYYVDDEQLAFASEIKALLPALPAAPRVDHDSLDAYLAHRSVPSPYTLFDQVRKLEPGTNLHVSRDGRYRVERYWEPPLDELDLTPERAVDSVEQMLSDAVDEALVADVPVGAYLSGGVDSSLICALASKRGDGRLDTFSAGFDDPRVDELEHARAVSDHLGTSHHETVLDAQDFESLWPMLTWHRDAPISEPADIAVFRLAQMARETVKVVLSGEGSDELFGGYPKYGVARSADAIRRLPAGLRSPILDRLQQQLPRSAARFRIATRSLTSTTHGEYLRSWFAPFTERERQSLLDRPSPPDRAPRPPVGRDARDRLLRVDAGAWLADNLLERGDRMSMATSLELRPPFLDARLVEYAFGLPSSIKVRGGTTKWPVKEVARRYLPDSIVDRRKVGFRVPLDAWFRDGLRDLAHDRLTSSNSFARQHFDHGVVEGLLASHDRGRADEEIRLWTLLALEVWHDVFFRSPSTAPTTTPQVIRQPSTDPS